jgi:hypothetical protein
MEIGPALAATPAPMLEMNADGEVQIAVDGSVSDYRLRSALTPAVAALVDRNVRQWHFEPIIVDGNAVVAKTAVHIGLNAELIDGKDNYRLRVTAVQFGQPQRNAKTRAPRYPIQAVEVHLGAKVLLAVRLDETGRVIDAQAYQTSLDARPRSDSEAEFWRRLFERASVAAAKDWRYDMTETINGKPIGANAIVPIVFNVREVGTPEPAPGHWKAYLPGPVRPAPWMTEQAIADSGDLSAVGDGQALALDSRFHLRDDVIGKAL